MATLKLHKFLVISDLGLYAVTITIIFIIIGYDRLKIIENNLRTLPQHIWKYIASFKKND
jgi:hypothetical protein